MQSKESIGKEKIVCKFCENIVYTDDEYFNAIVKGVDFIYGDRDEYGIFIYTGDSGCLGSLQPVRFCPMCGRKLSDKHHSDHAE